MDATDKALDDLRLQIAAMQRMINGLLSRINYLEAQDANALRTMYRTATAMQDARTEAQRIRASHGMMAHKIGPPISTTEDDG